jgi:hypothetical protein
MHLSFTRRTVSLVFMVVLLSLSMVRPISAQPEEAATPEADDRPQMAFALRSVTGSNVQPLRTEINAGQTQELQVVIENLGEIPVELHTCAADGLTNRNGGFGMQADSEPINPPTTWADYSHTTVTLEPGTGVERTFRVFVPPGTDPGQYVFGIAAENAEPVEIPGSDMFNQVTRKIMAVIITVPGPVNPSLELGEPTVVDQDHFMALIFPIANTGNIRIRPEGTLHLRHISGREAASISVAMRPVYAGHDTTLEVVLPQELPGGTYVVSLLLENAEETEWSGELAGIEIDVPELGEGVLNQLEAENATALPVGDPVQYADISATITNNGTAIPTVNVMLQVQRDGEDVERYPLAEDRALAQGETSFHQRYIPVDGWQPGTYTFQLVIAAVSGGTETVLATIEVDDEIVVP